VTFTSDFKSSDISKNVPVLSRRNLHLFVDYNVNVISEIIIKYII